MSSPAKTSSAREAGLALLLDDGTRKSHSVAENTAFVNGFFKGISDVDTFRTLTTSLYYVYEAMETSFDTCMDPRVTRADFKALRRLGALEEDMAYYYGGDDWRNKAQPSPATRAYTDHIKRVAEGDKPWLLVASMYTRYLGDLFGGQMMMGMAMKTLDLDPGKGVEFYKFDQITDNKAFIEEWYSTVNTLDFTEEEKTELVEEANLVFRYNIAIFEELEGNSLKAMASLALAALRERLTNLF